MTTCDETFAAGLEFAAYCARMRVHARAFELHFDRLAFVRTEELGRAPLGASRILVLTEDFCIDSVLNLPIVARLTEASPAARLRIARRDAHVELAAQFPGRGGASRLPTVIFLGAPGQVLGYWSERSQRDHAWMAEFLATDPMPELELKDGVPTPPLAAWMDRRYAAQRPFVEAGGWRHVRDELSVISKVAPMPKEPGEATSGGTS